MDANEHREVTIACRGLFNGLNCHWSFFGSAEQAIEELQLHLQERHAIMAEVS